MSTQSMSMTDRLKESNTPWWLVLIEGIALIILGALFITNTAQTTLFVTQLLGIYFLIRGIVYIVQMFLDHTAWGLKLVAGVLGIIVGIGVLQHPLIAPLVTGSALIIVLGIYGIMIGIIDIIAAFKGAGWGVGILGVLMIIIGIWLLANIGASTLALPWTLAILSLIYGVVLIIQAFRIK